MCTFVYVLYNIYCVCLLVFAAYLCQLSIHAHDASTSRFCENFIATTSYPDTLDDASGDSAIFIFLVTVGVVYGYVILVVLMIKFV